MHLSLICTNVRKLSIFSVRRKYHCPCQYYITGINKTSDEIRRRRWNWIGHVLRKDATDNCRVALGWQPEGKRAVGRPKTKNDKNERKSEGWNSWREVKVIAEDRVGWKTRVAALCASWRGEI